MKTSEALKLVGGLSKPSKMPGWAYGLPAKECKTGSKLRLVKDSVCYNCYALKGCYVFKVVQDAQYRRLASVKHELWTGAMALLINSIKPISSYKFKLPDLVSRIKSSLSIGIKLPSDDLIIAIIAKNFSDKQIIVEEKHIDYIIKRIDRSYEKISQFILTLDRYSLKKGSPFGLKMIKEVLKMI